MIPRPDPANVANQALERAAISDAKAESALEGARAVYEALGSHTRALLDLSNAVSDLSAKVSQLVNHLAPELLPPMPIVPRSPSAAEIAEAVVEATGRHHIPTSYPPMLRDWKGPLKLGRKLVLAALLAGAGVIGGMSVGYLVRDCQVHGSVIPSKP